MGKMEKGTVWKDETLKVAATQIEPNNATSDVVACDSVPIATICIWFPMCRLWVRILTPLITISRNIS